MKKTIYQLQHLKRVSLKSIITIILLSVFTVSFGQVKDPPGFDAVKERQKAIAKGVQADEIESFVNMQRSYYEFLKEVKEKGSYRKVIPSMASSFTRKSSTPNCPGTFENGTVSPWSGYRSVNNLSGLDSFVYDLKDFISGGVQAVASTGFDSVIATLPRVRPGGGNYSLKLANNIDGGHVDMATRSITATGTCISFWYALVFEYPDDHPEQSQPFFMFRVRDADSNIIASFVKSSSLDTTFFTKLDTAGSIVYRGWTQQNIDLPCKYIGKNVTIEIMVSDCSWGGHYGYAYVDDICFENCCNTCENLFNNVGTMLSYNLITYKGSTDSSCCYKFNWIFDPDIFKCSPFGVKIYNDSIPSEVFVDYLDSQGLVWTCRDSTFDASILDFCVKRSEFTKSKKLRIAFLDYSGNVICDTITKIIEPCHSTSSGCNCNSLFENSNFANTSIIKKDTAASDEYECCFTLEPFRDSTIMKCSYYGMRVYKDTTWGPSNPYIDSFSATPIGGPGANMNDTGKIKFCISAYTFSNLGPQKLRIEYLDSNGKVICSKTETVNCEESCCENVLITVTKDTTETDPNNCCISIFGHLGNCFSSATIELTEYTDSGWVTTSVSPASPMGMFSFVNLCRPNGDTTRYMIFIKDSTGKLLCNKEVIQTCPNCCDLVSYTATYVPPSSPYLDRCCWDINVSPTASMECNVWNWGVYDSLHNVPSSYPPFMPPSSTYQGRHCTPYIFAPNPAPGTSITINYCITRYLAVYDNLGAILCIKPIELCCSRTYTNNEGNPQGPFGIEIAPNPFDETFTVSMDVPQEMPVAVNVVNSIGAVVFTKDYGIQPQGMFTKEINLAGQPAGIYTLSVNNGLATVQIVKQ